MLPGDIEVLPNNVNDAIDPCIHEGYIYFTPGPFTYWP